MLLSAIRLIWLCSFVLIVPSLADAAPDADEQQRIIRQQQQLQRQNEERRQEQERLLREVDPPNQQRPAIVDPETSASGKSCILLESFQITGAPEGMDSRLRVGDFPSCKTLTEIDAILEEITASLIDQGLVTSRAYLVPEDLNKKILHINIIVGILEDVRVNHPDKDLNANLLLPGKEGQTLNLRDIEQAIDQINRLPSYQAKSELVPGKDVGGSVLVINSESDFPLKGNLTVDNSGQESTGERQASFRGTADNILGLYDGWYVNATKDIEPSQPGAKSESLFLNFSVPYGYWTARWSSSYFEYEALAESITQDFHLSGNSQTHSLELNRVVHRDQTSKTLLSGILSFKNSRNYIEDVYQQNQSRKLSVASMGLQHSRRLWGGVANAAVSFERGLKLLGALDDDTVESSDRNPPKAQFRKYSGNVGYYRPFNIEDYELAFSSQASAQWTPDTLYSSERMSLGGLYTVRGFRNESISGDNGLYVRNELQWTSPRLSNADLDEIIGRPVTTLGYDVGWIKDDPYDPLEGGRVTGLSLGLEINKYPISVKAVWERALDSPSYITPEKNVFFFSLGYSFG
ncbi:ShlB/FhaC/HecB family hemolysin secretion/activation protein [Thalassospira xianhensis]|uniref:POTRA domain-containing protein n=1 Tax=Thalassospira xianhensis MCCC 1A02616 TaxID=1177929 RepID=A0A367UGN9_9PROT|nr:ShlB/FhaC/HecB family hemolysin secretion/activation protein [Thalassospira xianhensis]RCK07171.1 hypothetical protein TH5_04330 [Thalassospira xianhensis MCCC 1A02616]